jgi:hypothetical protein
MPFAFRSKARKAVVEPGAVQLIWMGWPVFHISNITPPA